MQASSILLQVQINEGVHTCASRSRVEGCTMASQAWVAERAIPLLKKKPSMGLRHYRKPFRISTRFRSTIRL